MRTLTALLVVALLAGCIADPPPTLRARSETVEVPASPTFPGLTAQGTIDAEGDHLAIAALARNDGNWTYRVESGCGSPWLEELFRGGERLEMHPPQVRCQGYSLTDFGPGQQMAHAATWSGTYYDAEAEEMVDAPPGDYLWSVRFVAYHPDGFQLKRLDLDFNVTVVRG